MPSFLSGKYAGQNVVDECSAILGRLSGCIVFLQGIVVTPPSPVDKAAVCGSYLVLLSFLAEMLSIEKAYDSRSYH